MFEFLLVIDDRDALRASTQSLKHHLRDRIAKRVYRHFPIACFRFLANNKRRYGRGLEAADDGDRRCDGIGA